MVEPSTILLFNLLTLENLSSTRCELLQGQLLRLTTFRCRDEATRTPDPYVPNVVRYQLRYIPPFCAIVVQADSGKLFYGGVQPTITL